MAVNLTINNRPVVEANKRQTISDSIAYSSNDVARVSWISLTATVKADLPPSADNAGAMRYVTDDGGATAKCLAYSDGGANWKRVDDNNNLS